MLFFLENSENFLNLTIFWKYQKIPKNYLKDNFEKINDNIFELLDCFQEPFFEFEKL